MKAEPIMQEVEAVKDRLAEQAGNVRWTPSFRPRIAENKRDFGGLLSLLFVLV